MKKFITAAAFLAASTALASATTVVSNIPSQGIQYEWLFDNGSATLDVGSVSGENFAYAEGGYGTINGTADPKNAPYITSPSITAGAFTVSLDVSSFSIDAWSNLLSITDSSNNAFQIQRTSADEIAFYVADGFGGASGQTALNNTTSTELWSALSSSDWKTLTFTSDGALFTAYIDGVRTLQSEFTVSGSLGGLQFGALFGGGRNYTTGNVDNVVIWNRALSSTEVYSLTHSAIPEPSAFGLLAGVGALALVAARRRRSRKA